MKLIFIFISIILSQTAGYCFEPAKDIPEGLYKALYAELNKSKYFQMYLQKFGCDTTITVDDIDPGIPVQYYNFKINPVNSSIKRIEEFDINAPVISLIEPAGTWLFCLKARGEYILSYTFCEKNGKFENVSIGGRRPAWEEFWQQFPESTDIRPVLIVADKGYLHLPHINDRNLTLMLDKKSRNKIKSKLQLKGNNRLSSGDLQTIENDAAMMSDSYDSASVTDSRITLQIIRKRCLNIKTQKEVQKKGRLK
jgi:hypothetical protein